MSLTFILNILNMALRLEEARPFELIIFKSVFYASLYKYFAYKT